MIGENTLIIHSISDREIYRGDENPQVADT